MFTDGDLGPIGTPNSGWLIQTSRASHLGTPLAVFWVDECSKLKKMNFKEHFVHRGEFRIYAREYAGREPTIILMHGFPDNLHLYDRLVPLLSPPRQVVTFDFLGWGASDKPSRYPYTARNQQGDLDAVIRQLKMRPVVLVAHDASGPPAIDWALAHRDQVAALVLLNTYYCAMPT